MASADSTPVTKASATGASGSGKGRSRGTQPTKPRRTKQAREESPVASDIDSDDAKVMPLTELKEFGKRRRKITVRVVRRLYRSWKAVQGRDNESTRTAAKIKSEDDIKEIDLRGDGIQSVGKYSKTSAGLMWQASGAPVREKPCNRCAAGRGMMRTCRDAPEGRGACNGCWMVGKEKGCNHSKIYEDKEFKKAFAAQADASLADNSSGYRKRGRTATMASTSLVSAPAHRRTRGEEALASFDPPPVVPLIRTGSEVGVPCPAGLDVTTVVGASALVDLFDQAYKHALNVKYNLEMGRTVPTHGFFKVHAITTHGREQVEEQPPSTSVSSTEQSGDEVSSSEGSSAEMSGSDGSNDEETASNDSNPSSSSDEDHEQVAQEP